MLTNSIIVYNIYKHYICTWHIFVFLVDEADNCTLNAVTFLKQSEAATVNSIGQLKVWDLRQTTDKPSQIFLM